MFVQKFESTYKNQTDLNHADTEEFNYHLGMVIQSTLTMDADQWYYDTHGNDSQPPTWDVVKKGLQQRFGSEQKVKDKQIEFICCQQRKDDVETYITKFLNGENAVKQLTREQLIMLMFENGIANDAVKSQVALAKPETLPAMVEQTRLSAAILKVDQTNAYKASSTASSSNTRKDVGRNNLSNAKGRDNGRTCSRCPGFKNHTDETCWKANPHLKPKSFNKNSKMKEDDGEDDDDVASQIASLEASIAILKA